MNQFFKILNDPPSSASVDYGWAGQRRTSVEAFWFFGTLVHWSFLGFIIFLLPFPLFVFEQLGTDNGGDGAADHKAYHNTPGKMPFLLVLFFMAAERPHMSLL